MLKGREPFTRLPIEYTQEMTDSDTEWCYEYLDEGIREIVRALNLEGYYTYWSCQGGGDHQHRRAFINVKGFLDKEDRAEIRDIVERFTDVPFTIKDYDKEFHMIQFRGPVGLKYG